MYSRLKNKLTEENNYEEIIYCIDLIGVFHRSVCTSNGKVICWDINIYGVADGEVFDKQMAYATYEQDGTLVYMVNNITPSSGRYSFKKISGSSSHPNARNPYIYQLHCDYDNGQTVVLRLKEIDEDIIPGLRKVSGKRSYITVDPQFFEGYEVYLIFIKQ